MIVASNNGDGTNKYNFELDESYGFTPGTYAFIAQHNYERQAILPLVIERYDVTVSAPRVAKIGSEVVVTTETKIEDSNNTAEIIFANEKKIRTVAATVSSTGKHSGVIDTGGLSTGEYQAYMIVRGDETVFGQQEILAVGGPITVQLADDVSNIETPTATKTKDGTVGAITSETEQYAESTEMSPEGSTSSATTPGSGPQIIVAIICFISVIARIENARR